MLEQVIEALYLMYIRAQAPHLKEQYELSCLQTVYLLQHQASQYPSKVLSSTGHQLRQLSTRINPFASLLSQLRRFSLSSAGHNPLSRLRTRIESFASYFFLSSSVFQRRQPALLLFRHTSSPIIKPTGYHRQETLKLLRGRGFVSPSAAINRVGRNSSKSTPRSMTS